MTVKALVALLRTSIGRQAIIVVQVSQIGQFEAEMSSDSFQLLGMAERGFLPACLARRSRYETPTLAIALSSVGICFLSMFDFRQVYPSFLGNGAIS